MPILIPLTLVLITWSRGILVKLKNGTITVILTTILVGISFLEAKEKSYLDVFARAKEKYIEGNYKACINIIKAYIKKHGKEPPTEYLVPLLMEALIRENDLTYFKKLYSVYRRKFPDSKFIPRLLYLNGIVHAKEQDYRKAIYSFSEALSKGVSGKLDSLSIVNVEKICQQGATLSEITKAARNTDLHPRIIEVVHYYEFKMLHESGQIAKSKKLAQTFKKNYPKSEYYSDARKIISKSKSLQKKTTAIGLLAPLTGEYADIGKFIVQGVQLAIDEYNTVNEPKIELIILDTRGNMVETAKKTHELISVHKVQVIIGPVLSANATVTASVLMEEEEVVMVTPTATDDGIAELGENIFQMNVTLSILGKSIAKYAVDNLNIREFAVISPITEYGKILTDNFKEEIAKLGGEVLAEEHFDEGTNDFRLQFESLRLKLSERKWEQMTLEGQSKYGDSPRDQKFKDAYLEDSTIEIGGLFIPGESEDVTKVAAQVYFYKLRTQLLGSNGWHTNATILSGKKYVNDAIFSTNFEVNTQNEQWKEFAAKFKQRFNTETDRVAAPLGYDAAFLILEAMKNNGDGEAVSDQLKKTQKYHGVSGVISFDNEEGVNSEAAILKISNKQFIQVH